jgi:ribosomal 30S subunit maturation factor RimM
MTADGCDAVIPQIEGGNQEPNMSTHYRGHDVVDSDHRLIGTISDVLYDQSGDAEWAVVDLGLLRSAHYLPVVAGYMSESGEFVVPFDKRMVKAAPKANRRLFMDASIQGQLVRHYELVE